MELAVRSSIELVQALTSANSAPDVLTEIKNDQFMNLIRICGNVDCDAAEASRSITLIDGNTPSVFTTEHKTALVIAIGKRASSRNTSATKEQENLHLHKYYTKSLLTRLGDTTIPRVARIDSMVRFCHKTLRLKFPSPGTRKIMAATILLAGKYPTVSPAMCI